MDLAKKPFKGGFIKVQKILDEKVENIGAVGDQIFTDVIGAKKPFSEFLEMTRKAKNAKSRLDLRCFEIQGRKLMLYMCW